MQIIRKHFLLKITGYALIITYTYKIISQIEKRLTQLLSNRKYILQNSLLTIEQIVLKCRKQFDSPELIQLNDHLLFGIAKQIKGQPSIKYNINVTHTFLGINVYTYSQYSYLAPFVTLKNVNSDRTALVDLCHPCRFGENIFNRMQKQTIIQAKDRLGKVLQRLFSLIYNKGTVVKTINILYVHGNLIYQPNIDRLRCYKPNFIGTRLETLRYIDYQIKVQAVQLLISCTIFFFVTYRLVKYLYKKKSYKSSSITIARIERPISQLKCSNCNTEEINLIFEPCGHFEYCLQCGTKFHNCPTCDREITNKIKIFKG